MPYTFTTPTFKEGPIGGHRLFMFRTLDKGVTVVREGSGFIEVRYPSEDFLAGRQYWLGGHVHTIDDDTAAELMAAGYSDYLKEI